jgi:uncharacterized membrane protein YfcA
LLPAAILGRFAGKLLLRWVSQAHFRRITLVLLMATGATGIVGALRAFLG